MVQIPAEKIAEVRDKANIETVIGRSVRLHRKGRRMWGCCPFHQEKTASFSVSPDKGLFHCFGCQAGGDVFKFLMQMEGFEFPEAVRQLAQEVGVEIPKEEESPQARRKRTERERLFILNEFAAKLYEKALGRSQPAMRYLTEERGLTPELIERFKLGWAPEGWNTLTDLLRKKNLDLEAAQKLGLLGKSVRDGRPYDKFRGRLMFPIRLPAKEPQVAGFAGRRADWVDKDAPKYLNSPESELYDKSGILYGLAEAKNEIRRSRQALLVEGQLDVISLHQNDFGNTVAACGTALSSKHAEIIKKLAGEVVTLYDGDTAGQAAAQKAALLLIEAGLQVRVVAFPPSEDPDTYVRAHGQDALKKLIDEALSATDFFVEQARAAYVGGGIAGTLKAVEAVKPMIQAIKDPLEFRVVIAQVSKKLGMTSDEFSKHLERKAPKRAERAERPPEPPKPVRTPKARGSLPVVETALLKMFLESPKEVHDELQARGALRAFSHRAVQVAIESGIAALRAGEPFDAPRALETMQNAGLNDDLVVSLRQTLVEALPEKNEVGDCVRRLLKRHKDTTLEILRKRIEQETDPAVAEKLAIEATRVMTLRA